MSTIESGSSDEGSEGRTENDFVTIRRGDPHLFAKAKTEALEIIKDIEEHINEVDKLFSEHPVDNGRNLEAFKTAKKWFADCHNFFKKEKIKAVIFGSTSSGKSTTVNAILHKKVLESGMGHVTNCIIQIQGTEDKDKDKVTFRIDNGAEKKIQLLSQYLDPDSEEVLDHKHVVYVTCPTTDFAQLDPDVIILDCPGLDNTDEHDNVLSNHCNDADVFVLVADAKSTIRKAEVSFFKSIEDPTVFVLFNCWDLTQRNDAERNRAPKLRARHTKEAKDFLKKTNHHLGEEKFDERIYFVSAEEYLAKWENRNEHLFLVGHENRSKDFQQFEETFWKCTTRSALNTRFAARIKNGEQRLKEMTKELQELNTFLDREEEEYSKIAKSVREHRDSLLVKKEQRDKQKFNSILNAMKIENITRHAKSYTHKDPKGKEEENDSNGKEEDKDHKSEEEDKNPKGEKEDKDPKGEDEDPKSKEEDKDPKGEEEDNDAKGEEEDVWLNYQLGLYKHVEIAIKNEIQEIQDKYKKDISNLGVDLSVKETQETDAPDQHLGSLKFDVLPNIDPTYAWSFSPIALMKQMMYRRFYANQPTTSPFRSILQIGGAVGTAIAGIFVAGATATMTPVIGSTAAVGATLSYCHYWFDKSRWTEEMKIEYLQNRCTSHIEVQFQMQRKKLIDEINEIDEKLHRNLMDRLKCSEDEADKKYSNIIELKKKLERPEVMEKFDKDQELLSSFEKKYLQDDSLTRAQCAWVADGMYVA